MSYTWLTYNTATGALGAHEQTHSPMLQTTTVTVGTGTPTVTTASTTTLTASNNTSTSEVDGVTTTTTVTLAFDSSLVYTGQAIIGPFDGVTVTMDAAQQAAYNTPQAYLYQSDAFAANPAWPAAQLAQAQQAQITVLEAGYTATLNGGFTSSASGTALAYGFTTADQANMSQEATMMLANATTWPIEWQTPSGQIVSLTQAEFTQLLSDGQAFKWAQIKQLRTLIAQVQAATTVSAVQAIVWTAATY